MDKLIYGADTETYKGLPLSMQFYSEHIACDQIHFVDEKTAASTFLRWCGSRKRNVQHVVYIHNLAYDLVELLWGHHAKLIGASGDFDFTVGKWTVRGVYGTPTFCRVTNGHDISVMLVDSYSYFRGSLAKGAELFCPDLPKLRRPANLGDRKFTQRDTGFCEYAMRDAVVAYHMGCAIEKMHNEYDLQQCVSVADMASRIFRHKFLTYTIPQPSRDIVEAALLSYHGGKNNVTVDSGWYQGVTSLDISSAYPDAMAKLPAYSNGKLYRKYKAARVKSVPPHGVYCITGAVADCDWPVIFSHGFKPLHGKIAGVWVHGHEVNEALSSGELKLTKVKGYMYDADRDHQAPALRGFVDAFYALKEREKDPVLRYMQKLVLNSVSGKFIQTRKRGSCAFTDIDADTTVTASELVAGGMFHPFIASEITAHTRARIHRLEHTYKAIHTATDGIFTQEYKSVGMRLRRASRSMQNDCLPAVRPSLGSITVEANDATLLLLRNKCYVLYGRKSAKTEPSYGFKGRHIIKKALHGFQGSVTDLERLVGTGRRKYTVNRPNRLKESIKRGLTPNQFVKRDYVLKIGPLKVRK